MWLAISARMASRSVAQRGARRSCRGCRGAARGCRGRWWCAAQYSCSRPRRLCQVRCSSRWPLASYTRPCKSSSARMLAPIVAGVDRRRERVVAPAQFAPEGVVTLVPGLLEGEALQGDPHGIDLADVLDRQQNDVGAGVGHGDQQPFFDQLAQRLAQRPAADVELGRKRGYPPAARRARSRRPGSPPAAARRCDGGRCSWAAGRRETAWRRWRRG